MYVYDTIISVVTVALHSYMPLVKLKLRLHVAFKPVSKPVSVEPAWKHQV